MIGLLDLTHDDVHSWADAASPGVASAFRLGTQEYNIGADCLRQDPAVVALKEIGDDGIRQITFGELDQASARFVSLLRDKGVAAGDRVAVKLPQSIDLAVAAVGTLRSGAILVTVSDVLGKDAIGHRLHDSGARLLIARGTDEEQALAADQQIPLVEARAGWLDGWQQATDFPVTTTEDPALLLYTSGTTGKSKGVLHGHRVLLGHHALDLGWDRVRPGDVAYSPADWTWGGGLFLGLLAPLAYGMTAVSFRAPHFDPARTAEIMRQTGVSVGFYPPTALRLLRGCAEFEAYARDGGRLRAMVTGAEAVEPELLQWADDLGFHVNNAFGQTEANAVIGHAPVLGALDAGCLGRAYPGNTIAILDEHHQPVGPGEAGEIAIDAQVLSCMLRYWENPEATAGKFSGGWLLTGDAGRMDADGVLHFDGRSDDVIKSAGYRIGPAEIEAALLTHDGVARCAAVGVPDPKRGQQVVAYVILKPGLAPTDELTAELQSAVREQVGRHAYPRRIEYVTDLAQTSSGKVDRRALRTSASVG